MRKNRNPFTIRELVIAAILSIVLGLLDAETESLGDLFVGDSGANLIALVLYTIIIALILAFFRMIKTYRRALR